MVHRAVRHPRRRAAPARLRTVLAAALTAVLLLLAGAAPAGADTFDDIYGDYRRTQRIDPCKYTPAQLRDAKDQLGSDSDQYAPEFPDALDEAIAASGDCGEEPTKKPESTGGTGGGGTGGSSAGTPEPAAPATTTGEAAPTTTAPATPTVTTPAPAAAPQPSPAAQDGVIAARAGAPADDGPEGWTWGVLAAAIVGAAALGWALVNATDRISWLTPVGHSMGEAGWRISLRWAEFRDWLRFGSGR